MCILVLITHTLGTYRRLAWSLPCIPRLHGLIKINSLQAAHLLRKCAHAWTDCIRDVHVYLENVHISRRITHTLCTCRKTWKMYTHRDWSYETANLLENATYRSIDMQAIQTAYLHGNVGNCRHQVLTALVYRLHIYSDNVTSRSIDIIIQNEQCGFTALLQYGYLQTSYTDCTSTRIMWVCSDITLHIYLENVGIYRHIGYRLYIYMENESIYKHHVLTARLLGE